MIKLAIAAVMLAISSAHAGIMMVAAKNYCEPRAHMYARAVELYETGNFTEDQISKDLANPLLSIDLRLEADKYAHAATTMTPMGKTAIEKDYIINENQKTFYKTCINSFLGLEVH